jgi:hypothetical protein
LVALIDCIIGTAKAGKTVTNATAKTIKDFLIILYLTFDLKKLFFRFKKARKLSANNFSPD